MASLDLRNCTIRASILEGSSPGPYEVYIYAYNTYASSFPLGGLDEGTTGDYNASEDGSAPGEHSMRGVDPSYQFVSLSPFNCHLKSTSSLRDAGCSLASAIDIDGQTRPWGSGYDIGADEYVEEEGQVYQESVSVQGTGAVSVASVSVFREVLSLLASALVLVSDLGFVGESVGSSCVASAGVSDVCVFTDPVGVYGLISVSANDFKGTEESVGVLSSISAEVGDVCSLIDSVGVLGSVSVEVGSLLIAVDSALVEGVVSVGVGDLGEFVESGSVLFVGSTSSGDVCIFTDSVGVYGSVLSFVGDFGEFIDSVGVSCFCSVGVRDSTAVEVEEFLEVSFSGRVFVCAEVSVCDTDISLYELLPIIIRLRDEEASGRLKRLLDELSAEAKITCREIRDFRNILDVFRCGKSFLPLVAELISIDLKESEGWNRKILSGLAAWYKKRGTKLSWDKVLSYYLDRCTIEEVWKSAVNERGNYSVSKNEEHPYRAARVKVSIDGERLPFPAALDLLLRHFGKDRPIHVFPITNVITVSWEEEGIVVHDSLAGSVVRGNVWEPPSRKEDEFVWLGNCIAGCQVKCETFCELGCEDLCQGLGACETECQFNCQIVCQSVCQQICQVAACENCQVACQNYCQEKCEESGCEELCMYGCQAVCEEACVGCEGACEGPCQFVCQTECQFECETNIEQYCKENCQTRCMVCCEEACETESCEVGCEVECQSGCTLVCEEDCQSGCETDCEELCETECQTRCEEDCELECQLQGCQDSCQQEGCTTACMMDCQEGCLLGCQGACVGVCQGPCLGGCQAVCLLNCQGACVGGCQGPCLQRCQGPCEGRCMEACQLRCMMACLVRCTSKCQCICQESCTSGVTASALESVPGSVPCNSSCQFHCMSPCEMTGKQGPSCEFCCMVYGGQAQKPEGENVQEAEAEPSKEKWQVKLPEDLDETIRRWLSEIHFEEGGSQ